MKIQARARWVLSRRIVNFDVLALCPSRDFKLAALPCEDARGVHGGEGICLTGREFRAVLFGRSAAKSDGEG